MKERLSFLSISLLIVTMLVAPVQAEEVGYDLESGSGDEVVVEQIQMTNDEENTSTDGVILIDTDQDSVNETSNPFVFDFSKNNTQVVEVTLTPDSENTGTEIIPVNSVLTEKVLVIEETCIIKKIRSHNGKVIEKEICLKERMYVDVVVTPDPMPFVIN